MDSCSTFVLVSLEQTLDNMLSQLSPMQQTESITLTAAAGRITATPVISPINVPPFNNATMDGYAVRISELHANAMMPVAGKSFCRRSVQQ